MPNIDRLIQKLSNARGDVALREVEKLLKHYGYVRERSAGSHFHYRAPQMLNIGFPTHNNKVSAEYVREVVKILKSYGK